VLNSSHYGPVESLSFADLMWNLPLMDDLFLAMQGQNVMLVDFYLRDLERDLLRELVETERTPYLATVIVSALSQMWIFAVYELLRTWRQRIKDLKRDAQKPAAPDSAQSSLAGLHYRKQLAHLRMKSAYAKELDRAMTRIQPLFRRIEALRMNLAKHEVPKMNGVPALAPGYGRIDQIDGSISWQVDLGDSSAELVSRRNIADELRSLVIDRRVVRASAGRSNRKRGEKELALPQHMQKPPRSDS
jgi:hypothetical protein